MIYGFGELIDKVSSIERSCTLEKTPKLILSDLKNKEMKDSFLKKSIRISVPKFCEISDL